MNIVKSLLAAGLLALVPAVAITQQAIAQDAAAPVAAPAESAAVPADSAANAAAPAAETVAAPERMKPTPGIGMPQPGEYKIQEQFSPTGRQALWMHNNLLLPVITVISLFVLGLMLFIMVRFRRAANPNPSKTSHNTLIEIIWTVVPVLILVVIAVPSISLIAEQYKPAPKDALTVKITGYQWYWGYEFPDQGIPEYVSNILPPEKALENGEPNLLAVDNRLVLPVGRPIKLIITGADVIHSFAVPALWFKLDAVPGRLNERAIMIEKPGVYYGQCSELCGIKHGFMPIAIEARPEAEWEQWVRSQGGDPKGKAGAAAATTAAAPAPAAPAKI
ncbi:cytochrome c oxidase subunit II [Sphingobium sp. DEHP117]|uniref:cytochrome c oxidase subunit II n=1 Tax=Sphingobium sp. DEHP117 TaxID=2993436 RepID=UPI0027D67310|nr:cytochrome c oxidase subunit II [Sphingobium sp. DEHP117]MDQ4418926.1 cytochrome c oxidase subunit II [Sphingobium sp. DEHP117]